MSSKMPPTTGEPSKPRRSPVLAVEDDSDRVKILVMGWRK